MGSHGYFYSRSSALEISYLGEFLPEWRLNVSTSVGLFLPRKQTHIFFDEVGGVFVPYEGRMQTLTQFMLGVGTDYLFFEEDDFEAYAGLSVLGIYGNHRRKSTEINLSIAESQRQILAGNTVRVGCQYNPEGAFSYINEGSMIFQWVKQPIGVYVGFVSLGLRYDIKKGQQ